LWLRQYCRSSGNGLSITNLDYVVEDFKAKKIMLIEEKQNGGVLHRAQRLTFSILDRILAAHSDDFGYQYAGFFVVQFRRGCDMPGPGMTINGTEVTVEELVSHLNFQRLVVPRMELHSGGGRVCLRK
jgi:hypothetical protein